MDYLILIWLWLLVVFSCIDGAIKCRERKIGCGIYELWTGLTACGAIALINGWI